jgi:hypothetical protein
VILFMQNGMCLFMYAMLSDADILICGVLVITYIVIQITCSGSLV